MSPEGAEPLRYLLKYGSMLDPWIMVWQLIQGCNSADPEPMP
jgi:hypothetical protein